jgi:hypothetical protein
VADILPIRRSLAPGLLRLDSKPATNAGIDVGVAMMIKNEKKIYIYIQPSLLIPF